MFGKPPLQRRERRAKDPGGIHREHPAPFFDPRSLPEWGKGRVGLELLVISIQARLARGKRCPCPNRLLDARRQLERHVPLDQAAHQQAAVGQDRCPQKLWGQLRRGRSLPARADPEARRSRGRRTGGPGRASASSRMPARCRSLRMRRSASGSRREPLAGVALSISASSCSNGGSSAARAEIAAARLRSSAASRSRACWASSTARLRKKETPRSSKRRCSHRRQP